MPKKNKISLESIISKLGTQASFVITLCTIFSLGFGAGMYIENTSNNIKVLELKNSHYKEVRLLNQHIDSIQFQRNILLLKITEYEQKN